MRKRYTAAETKELRSLLRGLPHWYSYHATHFKPEITTRSGTTYHIMDIERLRDRILEQAAPRQREALGYWLQEVMEKDAAVMMGVPGHPVYMYVADALGNAMPLLKEVAA